MLDGAVLRRVVACVAPGADVTEVGSLRDGRSPWRIRLSVGGTYRDAVVRTGSADSQSLLRTEVAALQRAARHGIPAPRLLAVDLDRDPPVIVTEFLAGSGAIPARRPTARLRALGRAAAALHAIAAEPTPALPARSGPVAPVDFAALRRQGPSYPLLAEAEQRVRVQPSPVARVFVHGDLWQGNAVWAGDALAGLIDWDCAGAGAPGVDLGSLRCDAALCFGLPAADDVTRGWEDAVGRAAADIAYWDVVAALSTPPDMGWFQEALAGQGRPDLGRRLLRQRRDAFLRAALNRLGTALAERVYLYPPHRRPHAGPWRFTGCDAGAGAVGTGRRRTWLRSGCGALTCG
jgi:aminoglycoside phosphotransferase (APT) family kinase protein